ncbi:MAG TPA: type II CAAX endopeptidase family protein [Longimicrobiaceae bacterium]|nr:type II CAAX endopeptidase family protein [Longimicrobiaceae bacterium]
MRQILQPLAAYLVWYLAMGMALVLPPPAGLLVNALLFVWFLHRYVLLGGRPGERRRWAALRLRPLDRASLRAVAVAVPVLFALSWALGEVWTRLVPVPPESFSPFREITGTPYGRLTITLLAVVAAPVMEEFVFRGLVQRHLERRWGPAWAIFSTASLFALLHLLPWVFPLHLLLGLSFGYAVYATRSIWAGVILHAANNSLAVLGLGAEAPELPPTIWKTGPTAEFWTALGALGLASGAAVWVGQRLWRAGRAARVREVTWRGRERR